VNFLFLVAGRPSPRQPYGFEFAIVLFSPIKRCMPNLVMTLLSGLFVAAVTSILTVRLALWRFHSEKWWERKAELYSRLMEVLFDMHSYNRQWLEDLEEYMFSEQGSAQTEEQKKHLESLLSRHQKAEDEVHKIVVIGAFIVSDAVADDLMQLRKAHAEAEAEFLDDPHESAEKSFKAVEDCLARVREHAKEDLGITRKLPPIMKTIAPAILSATRIVRR
jgi:hypothetical protein